MPRRPSAFPAKGFFPEKFGGFDPVGFLPMKPLPSLFPASSLLRLPKELPSRRRESSVPALRGKGFFPPEANPDRPAKSRLGGCEVPPSLGGEGFRGARGASNLRNGGRSGLPIAAGLRSGLSRNGFALLKLSRRVRSASLRSALNSRRGGRAAPPASSRRNGRRSLSPKGGRVLIGPPNPD